MPAETDAPAKKPGFFSALAAGPNGLPDEMPILCVAGVMSFIGLGIYAVVWNHQAFDPMGYGTGLGAAIGAAAAGMGVKAKFGG